MTAYNGNCHCGLVKFQIEADLQYSVKCDCSICRRRGAIMLRCDASDLEILEGKEHLNCYQFNTNIAEHYFCENCGIYTFHKMRKLPNKYAVNSGCLEDVDIFALEPLLIKGSER